VARAAEIAVRRGLHARDGRSGGGDCRKYAEAEQQHQLGLNVERRLLDQMADQDRCRQRGAEQCQTTKP
jgi:hypothetical protein